MVGGQDGDWGLVLLVLHGLHYVYINTSMPVATRCIGETKQGKVWQMQGEPMHKRFFLGKSSNESREHITAKKNRNYSSAVIGIKGSISAKPPLAY